MKNYKNYILKPFITKLFLLFCLFCNTFFIHSQTVLNANEPGNTYEDISAVLAPGYTAIESPDQTSGAVNGSHIAFGRHIAEVWDTDLNKYAFEFYSHVNEDNDITGGLIRQRVEMKTYGNSPDNLKGVLGETVTYKWRFKLPLGFQPSDNFTHIHQVKAVDGDDSSPIFTLTPRNGSVDQLELNYTQDAGSSSNVVATINLSSLLGVWVEAIEKIKIGTGANGTYSMVLKVVNTGSVLINYSNSAIQTIRPAGTISGTTFTANSFIRPKWGIYRSLVSASLLRDESIRFADIKIVEGTASQTSLSNTITFNTLSSKSFGDSDFVPLASASSGLSLIFSSSNPGVATIVNGNIHIIGLGTASITASQSGNSYYNAATSVSQTISVSKGNQTILFEALSSRTTNTPDFSPMATASSGLNVTYSSSNPAVATIVNNQIHPISTGNTTITASQAGDSNYFPAVSVTQIAVITCRCNQ